jgi:ABC-type Fe3+ transport system permease subunit
MNLLKFSLFSGDAASVSIPLTLVAVVLIAIFLFQSFRKATSDGGVRQTPNGDVYDDKPVKWYTQTQTFFALAVLVLWVVAMFIVKSDYRPYNPKKDGVPKVQTDTTRISAEELIKK